MKAFLLHPRKDVELERAPPPNENALVADLGLDVLFEAMAGGDPFLLGVAKAVVLSSLTEPAEIVYRQHVLQDCLAHPAVVRQIYDIAVAAIDAERKHWRSFFRDPDILLHREVEILDLFVGQLRRLRRVADEHAREFRSEGFTAFFATLADELDDDYLRAVDDHVRELRFPHGVVITARLGMGNKGTDHVLRKRRATKRGWWRDRLPTWERRSDPLTLVIPPRDEAGIQALSRIRGRGLDGVANALARSTDHMLSFFNMVRSELGFYLACLNLRGRLVAKGEPVCFPVPDPPGTAVLSSRGLYDVGLSLRVRERVVGNDVSAEGRSLVMITGANQGGKSTFLRGVGIAQLMLQSGMFVGAAAHRASVGDGVLTHFKREEDPTMTSGKLDEELQRMSEIADRVRPTGLVLFNESFAATNEREGAEIARAIVRALLGAGIRVFFVTHSFELAQTFYGEGRPDALFLRAERRADGTRTFRLVESGPLPTSYGEDLYRRVFEGAADAPPAAAR